MNARSVVRWWFADRRTGRLTVVQRPNALSALTTASTVLHTALPGRSSRVAGQIRDLATLTWGVDELVRGVNPWRRSLGAAALGSVVWRRTRR